jgi:hypothetical protein
LTSPAAKLEPAVRTQARANDTITKKHFFNMFISFYINRLTISPNYMANKNIKALLHRTTLFNTSILLSMFQKHRKALKMHAGINLLLRSKGYKAKEMPNSVTFSSNAHTNSSSKRHQLRITSIILIG